MFSSKFGGKTLKTKVKNNYQHEKQSVIPRKSLLAEVKTASITVECSKSCCSLSQEPDREVHIKHITFPLSGLERKSSVPSSTTSRFSFWASNFSFLLAQWPRDQTKFNRLPTKSLIRKKSFLRYLFSFTKITCFEKTTFELTGRNVSLSVNTLGLEFQFITCKCR